jgi:hypothetical protein
MPSDWTNRTLGRKKAGYVADVGGPPLARDDMSDEMTTVARDVHHDRFIADVPLDVADDFAPDIVLSLGIGSLNLRS